MSICINACGCVYMHVSMSISRPVYLGLLILTYVLCICDNVYVRNVFIFVCMRVLCAFMCVCICVHLHMYACLCVYVCVCIDLLSMV